MAIKKSEFYEGAALHQLVRSRESVSFRFAAPFFLVDDRFAIYLKHCARARGPWGFTFMPDEQVLLAQRGAEGRVVIGLICGSDGIAALEYADYARIASRRDAALHVACYRNHGEHYEINGPDGSLPRKVAPSTWQRLFGGDR